MKKYRSLLLTLCILTLISSSKIANAQLPERTRLELEADPLAYLFKGYSLHLAVTHGHLRHSIGFFGIDQPKLFLEHKDFKVYSKGLDIKTDYSFRQEQIGFFVGMQVNYARDQIDYQHLYSKSNDGLNIGIRAGYRFFLHRKEASARGLYIAPWMAYSYSTNSDIAEYNGNVYRPSRRYFFPTFHLGWRF